MVSSSSRKITTVVRAIEVTEYPDRPVGGGHLGVCGQDRVNGGVGMDGLGLNLPGLITQFVNFGLLLAVLWIFLHRPLRRVLDERRKRIEEGLKASETAQVAAEEAQAEAQSEIQRGRDEGQELVAQAKEISERIQQEAREVARQESEQIIERARLEIQQEHDLAVAELRSEFANVAMDAAERVVGQVLDRNAHERLIDEVMAESSFGEGNQN